MTNNASANQRYQFKPFFGSSHTWALKQLSTLPSSAEVLDIGIGCGTIAQHLRNAGIMNIFGLEQDAEARAACSSIYKEIFNQLDQIKDCQFDSILLLDVLEHMCDPFAFLKSLQGLLKPNGQILISVPNVAHWSLRLSLLLGIWNYTERGLLDRTHYHFFTRKHLRKI